MEESQPPEVEKDDLYDPPEVATAAYAALAAAATTKELPIVSVEPKEPAPKTDLAASVAAYELARTKVVSAKPGKGTPAKPAFFPVRNRIPFTSSKFKLLDYANIVLGYPPQFVRYVYRCTFSVGDDNFARELEADDNDGFAAALTTARTNEDGTIRPAFGVLRTVFPPGESKRTNHIIPYLINNTGPEGKPTIWFLEQYDTTFWWLFNIPNWHEVVGARMIGPGNNYIRAYIEGAKEVGGNKRISFGTRKGGYSLDLQRNSKGISAKSCVPWSMVILKYLLNSKSVGVTHYFKTDLAQIGQKELTKMYERLNDERNEILNWVQGKIHFGGGKRRTRRRRQTRRKTKRSRK